MIEQTNDKQLDDFLRRVVSDAAADESLISEIADSPSLLWAVKRNIADEGRFSAWPPPRKRFGWLVFAVPAFAVIVLGVLVFVQSRQVSPPAQIAEVLETGTNQTIAPGTEAIKTESNPVQASAKPGVEYGVRARQQFRKLMKPAFHKEATQTQTTAPEVITRSEFIALSYSPRPESGQIVKLKVPSSMMVTLGLVASVEKPAALVDAEVIVSDDGVSHSIRFIR